MAKGDVLVKQGGVWSPKRGTIMGPGPAQLTTAWLPTFGTGPFPWDAYTLALWDWHEGPGATAYSSCAAPLWVPVSADSEMLVPEWPSFNAFVGDAVPWCRGPTERPNVASPDGLSIWDFDADKNGVMSAEELSAWRAYYTGRTSGAGAGGSIGMPGTRFSGSLGLSTGSWYDWQYHGSGPWYKLLDASFCEPAPGDHFTASMWVLFQGLPAVPTTLLRHTAMDSYSVVCTVEVLVAAPTETGGRGTALIAGVTLGGETLGNSTRHRAQFDTGALPLAEWCLLSMTHDGSDVRLYLNGVLMATTSAAGNIGWTGVKTASPGTDGSYQQVFPQPWCIGKGHGARDPRTDLGGQFIGSLPSDVSIGPLWLESTARDSAHLRNLYELGSQRY
jgi:hypothetical protein